MFNKPTDLPIDQIKSLQSRGYDNNQIVQALQRSGYTSTQIFDAMNQANLVNAGQMINQPNMPQAPTSPSYQQQDFGSSEISNDELGDDQIEQMIESIVNEKWQAVGKDLAKFSEWKASTEDKLSKMEFRIEELKQTFDKLHQAVIGKIGEYDKNILSVGAEIKAMEKVFSKVLPTFTENVNELNRITQTLSSKDKK